MAAVIIFIVKLTSKVLFTPPFGNFMPSLSVASSLINLTTILMPIILILASNAYLFYITTQSNKQLQQNRNLSGGEGNGTNKMQRLLRTLQMQAKPTASALILGGIDCGMILLMFILFAIVNAPSSSNITSVYIYQMTYLIEWGQMLSHFFVYGVYGINFMRVSSSDHATIPYRCSLQNQEPNKHL